MHSSFVLAIFTRPWYTVNSVTCNPFACFCFGSLLCSVVLYACPGFVIVLVFLVPHIKSNKSNIVCQMSL